MLLLFIFCIRIAIYKILQTFLIDKNKPPFSNVPLATLQIISDSDIIHTFLARRDNILNIGELLMPRSVSVIGWSTILFSIIIILTEFFGLLSNPMEQLNVLFSAFPQARNGMESMTPLFQYNRIWSFYTILYFLNVLAGAIQFVRFQEIGRKILEIACWVGMVNACVDSLLSYILWKNMQAALSTVMGTMGMSLGYINPLGMTTIILGFFLWIIPSIGMILYLRSPKIKANMKKLYYPSGKEHLYSTSESKPKRPIL
jgi:hypothetical protein